MYILLSFVMPSGIRSKQGIQEVHRRRCLTSGGIEELQIYQIDALYITYAYEAMLKTLD